MEQRRWWRVLCECGWPGLFLPWWGGKYCQVTLQPEVASRLLHEKWSRSVVWAFCNPTDCTLPGSSIHGILQARVLEWLAISFFRGSSWPRDRTQVPHVAGRRFTLWTTKEVCQIQWKFNSLTKDVLEWKSRMSLLSFSGRWDAATIQVSQGEMTTLGLQTPVPGAQEDVSLQFQSCVNAFLGHNVLSENVGFYIHFCTDQLKL